MYKAKPFLDIESLLALYYSLCQLSLQQYLSNKSEELHSQQKHAIRIVLNKSKFEQFEDCKKLLLKVLKKLIFSKLT